MRVLALLPLACLLACTPQQYDDTYGIACASVATADAAFQLYAATGKVGPKTIRDELIAVEAAQAVCNGPRPTDTRLALGAVQRAMAAIVASTRAARVQAGG